MKHHEFYRKYKASYPPVENPLFSRKNWWRIVLIPLAAVLIEPLIIMYKHQRLVQFSFHYYLQIIEYLLFIVVPFLAYLLWVNLRDWIKQSRGYSWLGKFEVIDKQLSFAFCYLLLAPGDDNKLRVNRDMFEKIRVGDFVQIRRDALGDIEEITKVKSFSSRLAKVKSKRLGGSASSHDQSIPLEPQRKQG